MLFCSMFHVPCYMLIFLHGEDDFRSSQKLKEIKEKFVINKMDGYKLIRKAFDIDNGQISNT